MSQPATTSPPDEATTPPNEGDGGTTPASTDGRHARSDRSRAAVAEALLALVNEGNVKPTAEQTAERAGVSIRSVFRHTADGEALARTLVDMHISRTSDLFELPEVDGDTRARIRVIVAHRRRLFEAIGPVRRAVRASGAQFGDVLASRIEEVNTLLRDQLRTTFRAELDDLGDDGPRVLDAIDMAASWPAWEQLHNEQGLDPSGAEAVVDLTVTRLVGTPG